MTPSTRQELFALVDALCEGTASRDQFARLESLASADRECLRLYLDAIELHGLLHWDAAGLGAALDDGIDLASTVSRPAVAVEHPHPVRRRAMVAAASVAACLAIVFGLVTLPMAPVGDPVAVQNEGGPREGTLRNAGVPDADLPEVRLPSVPVARGAVADELLAPRTDRRVETPRFVADSDDEVVRFIDEQLELAWTASGVQPSAVADDGEWVRRVHLDLAGRIPTTSEVEAFLDDPRVDKRRHLVDRLLDTGDFALNYATMWTNLLVGRSQGRGIERGALMSWLEHQFGENRSWNETLTELITANGPPDENPPATFLLAHLNNEAVPATAITARILLCEQLQCAQCHRHPAAASWDQNRFWELNAFFQQAAVQERVVIDQETGVRERVRELVDRPIGGESFYETLKGVMQVAYPKFGGVEVPHDEPAPLRQRLAELLCTGERPQVARAFINRNWQHLFGYGFTTPVDDMGPHNRPSHPELLDGLTDVFVDSQYDVKRLIRWICLSRAYQLSSRPALHNVADAPEAGEPPLFSRMYIKPLAAEQLFDSLMIAAGTTPAELRRRGTAYKDREAWLQQYFTAVETEENGESSTLDGSLTQVLMMMNGELVERAVHPEQGRVLSGVLSGGTVSETEKIRRLSLAALSRYPTNEELSAVRQVLRRHVKQRTDHNVAPQVAVNEGLRDIYWAYLNSSEFAVNR